MLTKTVGEGNGTSLQYSCLENPMDGAAWKAAVHGVAKSRTRLSNFTFTFHFHALEKDMATHSSVLAWRIPGTGEPGGLLSMGLCRVRHDWSDLAESRTKTGDRDFPGGPVVKTLSFDCKGAWVPSLAVELRTPVSRDAAKQANKKKTRRQLEWLRVQHAL